MTDDAMKALAEAATEAAFEQDMAHNPSEKAYHEGRVDAYRNAFNILSAALSAPAGLCGCVFDSSEPSGVCPKCHHREHGSSGCRAALSAPAEPDVARLARALRALCDEGDKPFMYFDDENEGRWGAESILRVLVRED